jgi:GNAT superfamily N-acetyltransferase
MRDIYSAHPIRATANLMAFDGYRPGAWLLTGVEVSREERGKGVARGVMQQVLNDADAEGVPIYLSVEPDGTGLGEDDLVDWYERLGFVLVEPDISSSLIMVREPRTSRVPSK